MNGKPYVSSLKWKINQQIGGRQSLHSTKGWKVYAELMGVRNCNAETCQMWCGQSGTLRVSWKSREMHAEPGLLESDVWCEGVVEDDWRCLLSKNKFLESWVVLTHCSLLVLPVSESARCSGCFSVPFCLSCFNSVSEHGCILPLQSALISL